MTNQKTMLVRLTKDQHEQVAARAKAAGLSVNQYAVKAMLCESPALTPDEAIRGAEAALERALAALRSPAPVQEQAPQEVTEAPVEAVCEGVVAPTVETPTPRLWSVRTSISDDHARTLAEAMLGEQITLDRSLTISKRSTRICTGVHPLHRHVTGLEIPSVLSVPTGTPIIVRGEWEIQSGRYKKRSLGMCTAVGVMQTKTNWAGEPIQPHIVWERLYRDSEMDALREWASSHSMSETDAQALVTAEADLRAAADQAARAERVAAPPVLMAPQIGVDSYLDECDDEDRAHGRRPERRMAPMSASRLAAMDQDAELAYDTE